MVLQVGHAFFTEADHSAFTNSGVHYFHLAALQRHEPQQNVVFLKGIDGMRDPLVPKILEVPVHLSVFWGKASKDIRDLKPGANPRPQRPAIANKRGCAYRFKDMDTGLVALRLIYVELAKCDSGT